MELRWEEVKRGPPPVARDCHSCVKWKGGIVVYGGHTFEQVDSGAQLGDVWEFKEAMGWHKVGDGEVEREGHTAVVMGKDMVVFGGMSSAGEPYCRTAAMDLETGLWEVDTEEPSIPPRFYHTASQHNGKMYIFGGCDNDMEFGDIWAYDSATHSWTQPVTTGSPPTPRYCHTSCVLGDDLYVFGGCQDNTNYNDIYRLNLRTMEWTELITTPQTQPPMPRYGMAMTTDPLNNLIYIFGGQDDHMKYNDLYVCKPNVAEETVSWAIVPVSMPPENRTGHSLKLGENGCLYLYGGNSDEGKDLSVEVLKLMLPMDISSKADIWMRDLTNVEDESCSMDEEDEESDEGTEDKPWLEEDAMAGERDFASFKAKLQDINPSQSQRNATPTNPNESLTTTCTSIGTSTDWPSDMSHFRGKQPTPTPTPAPNPIRPLSKPNSTVSIETAASSSVGAVHSAIADLESSFKRRTIMMNNRIQENADMWKLETTSIKNRLTEVQSSCDDGMSSLNRRMDRLEETVDRAVHVLQDQMRGLMQQVERLHDTLSTCGSIGSPGLR
eukprot:TRINITY_DN7883_c0_g1_i1.p1 TRINITY_DN7883_c0_g1~~TRINITY_DN7883_c0_g1_i1.p1  ORF type:complete len:553 (+),score=70.35 TRINITY_DN7883_c0_g1_i1:267-1925(+)